MEKAKVCLIHASATGTEILKNLVLPGIGSITIVDPLVATDEMRGSNFFLSSHAESSKRDNDEEAFRGGEIMKLLLEMNDQVEGTFDSRASFDDMKWKVVAYIV